ncbi:MAG: hypothetical protein ABIP63_02495 [Thermoanaerobaculia bacterium]
MRSIRSSFRARTSESGYALISAIALAILYFAVMQLIMIDSSRALHEAQRFRSKIVAATLAENAAELAAVDMIDRTAAQVEAKNDQGEMKATLRRGASDFELTAHGKSVGVQPKESDVRLQGRIVGARVLVDYSTHSQ